MNKRLFIIICIISFLITFFIININQSEYTNVPENIEMDKYVYDATYTVKEEKNVSSYISINRCIDIFLKYIKDSNTEAVFSVLTKDYKEIENITIDNIFEKIKRIEGNVQFNSDKVYLYDSDFFFNTYIVTGKIINSTNNLCEEYNYLLNIDIRKRTFEIAPIEGKYSDYISFRKGNVYDVNTDILAKIEHKIEPNNYNEADLAIGIGDKEVLSFYYSQLKLNIIYNTQKIYNLLNEEYRTKKFNTYENFVEYLNNNKENIEKSLIIKYNIQEFEEYKEYVCIDNFNNMIIFIEEEPMEYTVLLDEYTINDKIILNQYKNSDKKGKAQMNLEKFMHMINKKDYETAYNVLDEKFKEKYFNNIDKFIEYIKNNFFEYNEFNYEEMTEKDNNTIKIKTNINDKSYNSNDKKTKRFNIKLLENYGFNISFDI